RRLAAARHVDIVMAPGGPYRGDWAALHTEGWSRFCRSYRLDVCPPTDDKPFFFNMRRIGRLFRAEDHSFASDPVDTLAATTIVLAALCLIGFVLPLVVRRRRLARPTWNTITYFGAIGLGFITLEIVLIQRFVLFLGYPTYAL